MTAVLQGDDLTRGQRRRLRGSRAVASSLLVVFGAVFLLTLTLRQPCTAVLLLRAVAEAALVGGLADWFAVTALFRHPLGVPIRHTAILAANKDRIGEGLARFLDQHFLSAELLIPELRSLRIADRVATWLADRGNAAALADQAAKALPYFLHAVSDRQIAAFLGRALGPQLRDPQLRPFLGELIRILGSAGYHGAALDGVLDYAGDFLARHEGRLLEAVAEKRRGWMPKAINRQIARAMLRAASELIEDLRRPDGAARQALLAQIDQFATDLATATPAGGRHGAMLNRQAMRAWIASSWDRLRSLILADLDAPSPRLRRALALIITSFGDALKGDAAMRQRFDDTLQAVVVEALPWRAELIRFVTEVVRRWEPSEFSRRIENAVGADLQYIRMNGTLVGGLVGGGLYVLSLLAR